MNQPQQTGPSVRKRVLLTLFLLLPFLILAGLMYVLSYQLQKQGATLGEKPAQTTSK